MLGRLSPHVGVKLHPLEGSENTHVSCAVDKARVLGQRVYRGCILMYPVPRRGRRHALGMLEEVR